MSKNSIVLEADISIYICIFRSIRLDGRGHYSLQADISIYNVKVLRAGRRRVEDSIVWRRIYLSLVSHPRSI